ncbi:MAG: LOG family protein [Deltaproteobacteria bacterium]|nr:LOG family protein [Deltaproteobacteria bacterium]
MPIPVRRRGPYPAAQKGARDAQLCPVSAQTMSPSYRLAFQDNEFLLRDDCRPMRLELEFLKTEVMLLEKKIESTIVIFGSSRIPDPETAEKRLEAARSALEENPSDPQLERALARAGRIRDNSRYYEEARRLAHLISESCQRDETLTHVVATGGGPGIMEAANRGAHETGADTIGLNIVLPHEQAPNPYITPDLSFQFHYFALRKMHFLMRARALVVFPGGLGTLDELFETLTLVQTRKIEAIPILLFGRDYWERIIRFDLLVEEGTISPEDPNLVRYVETAEEAWEIIRRENGIP